MRVVIFQLLGELNELASILGSRGTFRALSNCQFNPIHSLHHPHHFNWGYPCHMERLLIFDAISFFSRFMKLSFSFSTLQKLALNASLLVKPLIQVRANAALYSSQHFFFLHLLFNLEFQIFKNQNYQQALNANKILLIN